MSYLGFPRIHFNGAAIANMATANNGRAIIDRISGPVPISNPVDVSLVGVNESTAEMAKAWLRSRPSKDAEPRASWNYAGDLSFGFRSVVVESVQTEVDKVISDPLADGLVGATAHLSGHLVGDRRGAAYMVDVNPLDAFSTQVFSDELSLQVRGKTVLSAAGASVSHSSGVNIWRNLVLERDHGGSCVFIFTYPPDAIRVDGGVYSPFLREVRKLSQSGHGLEFRICIYHLGTGKPPGEIDPMKPNPRSLLLCGTLGFLEPSRREAPITRRSLVPDYRNPIPSRKNRSKTTYFLGPTHVEVDYSKHTISLDFVNTIPESEGFDIDSMKVLPRPPKVDLGDLELGVMLAGPSGSPVFEPLATIARSQYESATYLARGGVVDVYFEKGKEEAVRQSDLCVRSKAYPSLGRLLLERPYVIHSSPRGVYLAASKGEEEGSIELTVSLRGERARGPLNLQLEEWTLLPERAGEEFVPLRRFETNERTRVRSMMVGERLPGGVLSFKETVALGGDGKVRVKLRAVQAGMARVVFRVEGDDPLPIDPSSPMAYFQRGAIAEYVNVRVFPDDDYSAWSAEFLADRGNWPEIYEELFMYYDVLFPAMSRFIDFRKVQEMIDNATLIGSRLDRNAFNFSWYMPVTRDLSPGKEKAILRWVNAANSLAKEAP